MFECLSITSIFSAVQLVYDLVGIVPDTAAVLLTLLGVFDLFCILYVFFNMMNFHFHAPFYCKTCLHFGSPVGNIDTHQMYKK